MKRRDVTPGGEVRQIRNQAHQSPAPIVRDYRRALPLPHTMKRGSVGQLLKRPQSSSLRLFRVPVEKPLHHVKSAPAARLHVVGIGYASLYLARSYSNVAGRVKATCKRTRDGRQTNARKHRPNARSDERAQEKHGKKEEMCASFFEILYAIMAP